MLYSIFTLINGVPTHVFLIIAHVQWSYQEKYAGPHNFLQTAFLLIFTVFCSLRYYCNPVQILHTNPFDPLNNSFYSHLFIESVIFHYITHFALFLKYCPVIGWNGSCDHSEFCQLSMVHLCTVQLSMVDCIRPLYTKLRHLQQYIYICINQMFL